jgi:hypothetical protein
MRCFFDSLLRFCNPDRDVLYFLAMAERLSPAFTTWYLELEEDDCVLGKVL